jgi:general stress protein 26
MEFDKDYSKIYKKIYGNNYGPKHADIFPRNIFMILAGSTGSGKTNLLINMLMNGSVKYDDIKIYTTTPYQDNYQFLRDYFDGVKKQLQLPYDIVTFHNPEDGIEDPSHLDKSKTHIVVFDDVMNENQKVMTDYFTRGRHNNANVFYLCQSIHQLKKHGIRQNANIFILFHQDDKTLKYFYETHISADMPLEEFKSICRQAWSKDYGFIVINLWQGAKYGRYNLNYNTPYIPEQYFGPY